MTTTEKTGGYKGWAILELMGHRRLAGFVSEEAMFGTALLRIDIPKAGATNGELAATQYYGGSSIYCLTPTTEGVARRISEMDQPAPVQPWEIRQLPAPRAREVCQEHGVNLDERGDCPEC
jgi:hypothetical protein